MRAGSLLLGLLFAHCAFAEDPAMLREMHRHAASCVQREDSKHAVFHGCFDWHSAVHGFWALFRVSLVTGETNEHTRRAERIFSEENLRIVRQRLAQELSFENPYGRAWFLQLAVDFERWATREHAPQPGRFRPLADEVADSILSHYAQEEPSPFSFEYDNASWAFFHLHQYLSFTADDSRLRIVRGIISTRFLESDASIDFSMDGKEFFSVFGNWAYLIAKTQSAETLAQFLRAHPIPAAQLEPKSFIPGYNHSLGLNWARAWVLRALADRAAAASDRARFQAAFDKHVSRGMRDHWTHASNYNAYGHWVPQFAIYALSEGL